MSFMQWLFPPKVKSAEQAKERLQIILAHERVGRGKLDFLPALQKELVEVISRYVNIKADDIKVSVEKQDNYEVLEVNIVLPDAGVGR